MEARSIGTGESVAVTAAFTANGRCRPRSVVYGGQNLLVDDILEERREGQLRVWTVRAAGGLNLTLTFDPETLRWVVRRAEAAV